MNRFLKILALLIVSLFFVVSGVNATLDHLTRSSTTPNSYVWYNEKGDAILAYSGNFPLGLDKASIKPPLEHLPRVIFLHRTSATASDLHLIQPQADSGRNIW